MKYTYIALLLFSLTLMACKKRKIFKSNIAADTTIIIQKDFHYLSAKAKIQYTEGEDNSKARLNLRICKDSLIWASINKTGVEGLRVMISKDSIFVINRVKKRFDQFSFKELSQRFSFKLSYQLIQSLLVGEMPIKECPIVTHKDGYSHIPQKTALIKIDNYINPKTSQLVKIEAQDLKASHNNLKIVFNEFFTLDKSVYPRNIASTLTYQKEEKHLKADLNIHYENMQSASTLRFPFNIPKSYLKKQ